MVSLIFVIISIVLVGLLSIATFYYISDTSDYREAAVASRIVNENQQVAGAISLYRQDKGTFPASLSDPITDKYLTSALSQEIRSDTNYLVTDVSGISQCKAINAKLGLVDVNTGEGLLPACNDPAYAGKSYCCETP